MLKEGFNYVPWEMGYHCTRSYHEVKGTFSTEHPLRYSSCVSYGLHVF